MIEEEGTSYSGADHQGGNQDVLASLLGRSHTVHLYIQ